MGPDSATDTASVLRPGSMSWSRPSTRSILRRHAAAWLYLAVFCIAELVYALIPRHDQAAVLRWASTNVHNLTHDPVGSLIASAFFPTTALTAWPILIALTLFGANRALGNWRMVVTCSAGHVIGTLLSEGILWYRILHDTMPPSDRFINDVGPSYVVVTAIAVTLIWGGWLARAAAAAAFAALIVVGQIFSGITELGVAPVGHATALVVGATLGSFLVLQRRRSRTATATQVH